MTIHDSDPQATQPDTAEKTDVTAPQPAKISKPTKPKRYPLSIYLSAGWLIVLVLGAIFAGFLDPYANNYAELSAAPSLQYPMGTDNLGRDMLARTLHGARSSAIVALLTVLVGGGVGLILGVISGYYKNGPIDSALGFLSDVMMAVPVLVIVSVIVSLRGPTLLTISLTLAIFSIPSFLRVTRAATMTIAGENYVLAARTLGASTGRILFKEILPGVLPQLKPYILTSAASAIIGEGSLSFLGFGLQPPEPSWGNLIAEGRTQLNVAPWVTMGPALVLCLTLLAINVIAEHLREGSE